MNRLRFLIWAVLLLLSACQSISDRGTIAELQQMKIDAGEEKIENGLDKAMLSYQHFLEKAPESDLTPEAIRRLADLKIEKEYGTFTGGEPPASEEAKVKETNSEPGAIPEKAADADTLENRNSENFLVYDESEWDF